MHMHDVGSGNDAVQCCDQVEERAFETFDIRDRDVDKLDSLPRGLLPVSCESKRGDINALLHKTRIEIFRKALDATLNVRESARADNKNSY